MDIQIFKQLYALLDEHFPGISVHATTTVRCYVDMQPIIEYRLWIGAPLHDTESTWWKSFEAPFISNLQVQVQNYCQLETRQDPWNA